MFSLLSELVAPQLVASGQDFVFQLRSDQMSKKKTWLEEKLGNVQLLPERWYLIFRALDDFTGLVDMYGGSSRHFALWIVLVMQVLTDSEEIGGNGEKVLRDVDRLLTRRLETGRWEEGEL